MTGSEQTSMAAARATARRVVFVALVALVSLSSIAAATSSASASAAAGERSVSSCKIAIAGAPWQVAGAGSGSRYTVQVKGAACATAHRFASLIVNLTHLRSRGIGVS